MQQYNKCTIDQELVSTQRCCIGQQTLRAHSPGGSTSEQREIMSWHLLWNSDVIREIWRRQSMRIYLKNIRAKIHPDPIWNDGALGYFWRGRPNKKNKKKMGSDMRSVPYLKQLLALTLCTSSWLLHSKQKTSLTYENMLINSQNATWLTKFFLA